MLRKMGILKGYIDLHTPITFVHSLFNVVASMQL